MEVIADCSHKAGVPFRSVASENRGRCYRVKREKKVKRKRGRKRKGRGRQRRRDDGEERVKKGREEEGGRNRKRQRDRDRNGATERLANRLQTNRVDKLPSLSKMECGMVLKPTGKTLLFMGASEKSKPCTDSSLRTDGSPYLGEVKTRISYPLFINT